MFCSSYPSPHLFWKYFDKFLYECSKKLKRKKHRKREESKNRQEDPSINWDENKNHVEDIDEEKDKEIAKKGDRVDKKTSRYSQLIFDRDAIFHKVLWIGKILDDVITD